MIKATSTYGALFNLRFELPVIVISSSSASELGTAGEEEVGLNLITFDVAFGVAIFASSCLEGPALLLGASRLGDG